MPSPRWMTWPARWWARMDGKSVRSRLTMLTVLTSILVMVGGMVALVGLRDSLGRAEQDTHVVAPALDSNRELKNTMVSGQSALRGYLIAKLTEREKLEPAGSPAVFLERYETALTSYQDHLDRLDSLLAAADGVGSVSTAELTRLRDRQRQAVMAWWAYAASAKLTYDITPLLLMRGDALFADVDEANAALSRALLEQRDSLADALRDTIRATQRQVLISTVAALLAAALLGWWSMRDLTVPLARLRDTCLRQSSGSRDVWADEDRGAREVRELAVGLNALTSSHHTLLDGQTYALKLAQVARETGRRIQDAPDLESAVELSLDAVGTALGSDDCCLLMIHGVAGGERGGFGWKAGQGSQRYSVSEEAAQLVRREVRQLWKGERCLAIPDVTALDQPSALFQALIRQGQDPAVGGAVLVAPFGVGEVPRGVMTARFRTGRRTWSEVETGFVQFITAELARGAEAEEVAHARSEQMTRLEELDRQKDEFLSTVSHELRTPLTSIAGYLELIADEDVGSLAEEQRQMLGIIDRNVTRLRGLIEDLLLINRMRDSDTQIEAVDLDALVMKVGDDVAAVAEMRGVCFEVSADAGAQVMADRGQLTRAVSNIVSNAVKFTGRGRRVRVRTVPSPESERVRVVCVDEGIGIPDHEQSRLFTRFFRASNATRAQVPGAGLGLVVAKGIVEAHGGAVTIHSVQDVGTTVTVELPLVFPAPS
ncbi:HAMP domain-containing sensor histidine kinase [Austwickia sp. TVS 96-490-7B]|uniref:sensor histidine kinase n=1 Tax=Austwickia sp. TVS 96-490-7B TaxID=2830843 RepID=UPI001C55FF5D|nr:HAMP domain-containing sensor histidine kinase [Austwickia sp. TVS 96-490-7B]